MYLHSFVENCAVYRKIVADFVNYFFLPTRHVYYSAVSIHELIVQFSSSLSLTLSDSVCMKDRQTQDNSLYFELSNQDAFFVYSVWFLAYLRQPTSLLVRKKAMTKPIIRWRREKCVYQKTHLFPRASGRNSHQSNFVEMPKRYYLIFSLKDATKYL